MEDKKKIVPVMSVKKALDLLEALVFLDVKREGSRLSDLAASLGVPDNTARNLLKTMMECGFVAQTPDSRYVAGEKCRQIGNINRLSSPAADREISIALNKFNEKIDETVVFAILSDGYREILAEVSSKKLVKVAQGTARTVNIYATATGRTLAANASPRELERIIARYGMPGEYWDGVRNMRDLKRELELIRKAGRIIIESGELVSFSLPVLDAEGGLVGSVGCYAPAFRWPRKRHGEMLQALGEAASALSSRL